jgi:LPS-assembly lipoprotein
MKKVTKLLLMLVLVFLTACGYHMRGSIALPEELRSMYFFGVSGSLDTELKALLKAADAGVATSPNDAGVVLKALKEDLRRRVISVGSSGKSSEIELLYYLRFQFYDNQENTLLDEQVVELNREFFNDQTALLAKAEEEQTILKEIYRQAARMVLARAKIAAESRKK